MSNAFDPTPDFSDDFAAPPADDKTEALIPDREMLIQFANLMFKRADQTGFVSLRAFRDNDQRDEKPIFIDAIRLDDPDFAAIVVERARQAANWDGAAVYCPPIATFKTPHNAKTDKSFTKALTFLPNAIGARRQHGQSSKSY